jgi:hypothetical protein
MLWVDAEVSVGISKGTSRKGNRVSDGVIYLRIDFASDLRTDSMDQFIYDEILPHNRSISISLEFSEEVRGVTLSYRSAIPRLE